MEDTKVYPIALAANGYTFKEKCMCSGVKKFKFENRNYPGIIVEWWVKYFKFRITDRNSVMQTLTPLGDLDNSLKAYARNHPVAVPKAEAKTQAASLKTTAKPVAEATDKDGGTDGETITEDKKLTNDNPKVSKKSVKETNAKDEAPK